MPDRGRASLDELIVRAFDDHYRRGPACWATSLEGEAREFLQRVEEGIRKGRRPRYTAVAAILEERWGIRRGSQAISRHLRRLCDCPRDDR